MNVARDLLCDLSVIGATVEPAGDRLILRAGPTAIPATLVRRVREAKADLLTILAAYTDHTVLRGDENKEHSGNSPGHRTFEALVINWMNRHPAPSAPGRCAWCGRPESAAAVVLPFGTEPGTHSWLHPECWPGWHETRRAEAIAALRITARTPESAK
jgi:hypothetical protein